MNGFKDAKEIAEYREKLAKLQVQMDALLAQGAEAMQREDEFLREHKIQPGMGKEKLLGPEVSAEHRVIWQRLMEEYEMMEERLVNHEKSQSGKSLPVSARAIGNRYRI
jgi:hypothetical protein